MAIKAKESITIFNVKDIEALTTYYKLQASTATAPSAPTVSDPVGDGPNDWKTTEPTYTEGSTNTLYTVEKTTFSDGTWEYSEVSKSTAYEAAKSAYNKAANADKNATTAVTTANTTQTLVEDLKKCRRNLILKSDTAYKTSAYLLAEYTLSCDWEEGKTYTVAICGTLATTKTAFGLWTDGASTNISYVYPPKKGEEVVATATFTLNATITSGNERRLRIYNYTSGNAGTSSIRWIKLEEGSAFTGYQLAPEDINNDIFNQNEIFNRLTNKGQDQGIYLENGKIYLNGEYIKAGTVTSDHISVAQSGDGWQKIVFLADKASGEARIGGFYVQGTTLRGGINDTGSNGTTTLEYNGKASFATGIGYGICNSTDIDGGDITCTGTITASGLKFNGSDGKTHDSLMLLNNDTILLGSTESPWHDGLILAGGSGNVDIHAGFSNATGYQSIKLFGNTSVSGTLTTSSNIIIPNNSSLNSMNTSGATATLIRLANDNSITIGPTTANYTKTTISGGSSATIDMRHKVLASNGIESAKNIVLANDYKLLGTSTGGDTANTICWNKNDNIVIGTDTTPKYGSVNIYGSSSGNINIVGNTRLRTLTGTYYATIAPNSGMTANRTITLPATAGTLSYSSSDIRLKKNIKETEINAIQFIDKIPLKEFDWDDHEQHQRVGVIADDLERLDSDLTFGGGYNEDGSINVKGIDTLYLCSYLIKAVQELTAEVNSLKAEIKELKKER